MGCGPKLLLLASLPALWFFPRVASILLGINWILLLLLVYSTQRNKELHGGVFTADELELANKYTFYFSRPLVGVALATGAANWQLFTFIWAVYLGYKGLWWYLLIPLIVNRVCSYLRLTCNPIWIAQDNARVHAGTAFGFIWSYKLELLQSIQQKLYGDHPIWLDPQITSEITDEQDEYKGDA